jgi:hypothetical protein
MYRYLKGHSGKCSSFCLWKGQYLASEKVISSNKSLNLEKSHFIHLAQGQKRTYIDPNILKHRITLFEGQTSTHNSVCTIWTQVRTQLVNQLSRSTRFLEVFRLKTIIFRLKEGHPYFGIRLHVRHSTLTVYTFPCSSLPSFQTRSFSFFRLC